MHSVARSLALAGLALVPLSFTPAQAQDYRLPPPPSEEGIQLSDWVTIKPYSRLFAGYTSNLFARENRNKKGDTHFKLTAGTDVLLGDKAEDFFEIGYAGTYLNFLKHHNQSTFEHRARYATKLDLGEAITFSSSGSGSWAATSTDPQFAGRVRNFSGFGQGGLDFRPAETVTLRTDGDLTYVENFPSALRKSNTLTSRAGAFVALAPDLPWGLEVEVGSNYRQIHYVSHQATNPDLEFVSWQLGARVTNELLILQARAGYEVSWVKKRRQFSRQRSTPEGLFASASATLTPNETTTFTVFSFSQIAASSTGNFQRDSHFGTILRQEIPLVEGLYTFLGADWNLQVVRHGVTRRTQQYRAGVGWSAHQRVELGGQLSYSRTGARTGGYETFETGAQVTFRY